LIVKTKSPEIVEIRKMLIEMMLARCPEVNVIRDLAKEYGVGEPRFPKGNESCILCGLCTRICEERVGVSAVNFANRGVSRRIESPLEETLGMNLADLCIGCGACANVCPTGTIKLEEIYKKIKSSFPFGTVEERTFGKRRAEDEVLGIYKNCYAVKSKKVDILERAQDGGAVTSFLAYALDEGIIDGAVITVANSKWEPSIKVAKCYDDLKQGAGTKYTYYPSGIGISEAAAEGCKSIAFVGLPCQIGGLRKLLTTDQPYNEDIGKEKIKLLVGLFCMDVFHQGLMDYVNEKIIPLEKVRKVDIKGREFRIFDKNGEKYAIPLEETEDYVNKECFSCTDFAAELADISIGSVGSEPGWSTVLTRTDKGEKLLGGAIKNGYVKAEELKDLKKIERLAKIKRKRAMAMAERGE
jgi:coenzyme F420 hydrogenase subunit beta